MSRGNRSFPAWAWWLCFLLGWPYLMGFAWELVVTVTLDTGGRGAYMMLAAILVSPAWLVGHFAGVTGAPKSVFAAILLGSLPLGALLAQGASRTGDAAGWAASLILPPLVVFIEMRRVRTNSTTASGDGAHSEDPTSQSDT